MVGAVREVSPGAVPTTLVIVVLWVRLHCQLHLFLHEYVERDFLERVRLEYFDKMNSCTKRKTGNMTDFFDLTCLDISAEAAKATAPDQKTLKVTGSKLCVLNVSLVAHACCVCVC